MKKLINLFLFSLLFIVFFGIYANCEEAEDITKSIDINCINIQKNFIIDNNMDTHSRGDNVNIAINSQTPMGGIYFKYYSAPQKGSISTGKTIGENGFYHEFVALNGETNITVDFPTADICEMQVFGMGDLPKEIQTWQLGNDKTDILLCATHSDDDQLFFAGLLPKYSYIESINIQVAYFVNHNDAPRRIHELLDGLWHCGIKNYPDISQFPDGYSLNFEDAKENFEKQGFGYEQILEYQKYLLNHYKPLVVVLHDFKGEYSHGQHIINTASFVEAVENADDSQYIPEKIYVHLYEENPIVLDIDSPIDHYNGKSAFNVSQEAFMFHKSQHWTWFYDWIYGKDEPITNSQQIETYNPSLYGLYYSRVGNDVKKDDILENIRIYAERTPVALPESSVSEETTEPIQDTDTTTEDEITSESSNDIQNQEQTKNKSGWLFYLIPIILFITTAVIFCFKKKR